MAFRTAGMDGIFDRGNLPLINVAGMAVGTILGHWFQMHRMMAGAAVLFKEAHEHLTVRIMAPVLCRYHGMVAGSAAVTIACRLMGRHFLAGLFQMAGLTG